MGVEGGFCEGVEGGFCEGVEGGFCGCRGRVL